MGRFRLSGGRAGFRAGLAPPGVAFLLVVIATEARASDAATVTATAKARARIEAPASISANQDLILGAVRLRAAMRETTGVRASRTASTFTASTGRARAFFVISGQADQAVSVDIPGSIALTEASGGGGVVIETATISPADTQERPPLSLDRRGLLAFGVIGRLTARQTLDGDYRGLLIATAQYN